MKDNIVKINLNDIDTFGFMFNFNKWFYNGRFINIK